MLRTSLRAMLMALVSDDMLWNVLVSVLIICIVASGFVAAETIQLTNLTLSNQTFGVLSLKLWFALSKLNCLRSRRY